MLGSLKPIKSSRRNGFTLPELLVATLIAAAIAALTSQVMIGQLIEGRRLELAQRLRENTSRFNYLVQVEASEAERVEVSADIQGCGDDAPTESDFTLWTRRDSGEYTQIDNESPVHYYNSGGSVFRCGPRVSRNGRMVYPEDQDAELLVNGPVVVNSTLVLDPGGGCAESSNTRQVVFRLEYPLFGQASAGDASGCTIAHAKSIFVCNPPLDPDNPDGGDCE